MATSILFDDCLLQVSNKADAIKIACDFVCAENLPATVQVMQELREHRMASGPEFGDDVLQLYNMLWYMWRAMQGVKNFSEG